MWDNIIMAISSTSSTLNLKDVVTSLLSKEIRQKSSKYQIKDSLREFIPKRKINTSYGINS